MFPLHQSNEMCFQISPNSHSKFTISEDLVFGQASLEENNVAFDHKEVRIRRKRSPPNLSSNFQGSNEIKNKKKMKHRDVERLRRQEMATLHASLRSLLPLQLIQGKRSISDHINETVRYIKHLQLKIKELGAKRDGLKEATNSSTASADRDGSGSSSSCSPMPECFLTVQRCCVGVEITIRNSDFGEGKDFPLSRALEVLFEEGLSLVSCVSTKANRSFLHTIQSEATDIESIDMSALEKKLEEVISSS